MQKDEKYVQGLVKPGKREIENLAGDVLKSIFVLAISTFISYFFSRPGISGSKYYYRIYSGGSDNGYMDFKESIQSCQFRYQRPAL